LDVVERLQNMSIATRSISTDEEIAHQLQKCILAELDSPDGSIPPKLLSSPASRDPSPRCIRKSKTVG